MILDEAQALKSSSSARWKTLLSFNCRNRLLLTGTPIQNSMAEVSSFSFLVLYYCSLPYLLRTNSLLPSSSFPSPSFLFLPLPSCSQLWALLHFIMPTLFDSHQEFAEWFSKDIEQHAENSTGLNEHQLSRLHLILKPFMLRRVKKEVEHEMAEKVSSLSLPPPGSPFPVTLLETLFCLTLIFNLTSSLRC
jgi:DNA helicase INO80